MLALHLRQLEFTDSVCGLFAKHFERIQKLKKTGDLSYIYKSELGRAWFTYDAAYANSKDLAKNYFR